MMRDKESGERCPQCRGTVIYRYGKTPRVQQRYRCVLCGRQFTPERKRIELSSRPSCPACGKPMYLYRRTENVWRFRCSAYPVCATYRKQEV